MSRSRITHQTTYRYAESVRFGVHRLVVRPREGHDIHVEKLALTIQPAAQLTWHRDLFGNSVALAHFEGASDTLDVRNEVIVARRDHPTHEDLFSSMSAPYPIAYSDLEKPVATGYRNAVYPEELEALKNWVDQMFHAGRSDDSVNLVRSIGTWIKDSIRYRRREERGVQSPLETLALQSGSCRDMATLMLEAVRALGIATRFATGYLDSPTSTAGQAATHAWMEAYFPDHGWFGFDPTLGEGTSHKHIVAGVSSHPRGVMPVSGVFFGERESYLGMEVSVSIDRLPPS